MGVDLAGTPQSPSRHFQFYISINLILSTTRSYLVEHYTDSESIFSPVTVQLLGPNLSQEFYDVQVKLLGPRRKQNSWDQVPVVFLCLFIIKKLLGPN